MKITKKIIFAEAKDILIKQGYDGLTFANLSKKLKVTRPALYKYYNNKDALILDLMVDEMTIFLKEFDDFSKQRESQLIEIILKIFVKFASLHQLFSSLYRVEYQKEEVLTKQMVFLKEQHGLISTEISNLIDQGKKRSLFRKDINNDLLAQFLMVTIELLTSESTGEEIADVKKIIMSGIGIKE